MHFFVFISILIILYEKYICDGFQLYVPVLFKICFQKILIQSQTKKIRIFDLWMYNNEAAFAFTRIWRLYNFVDFFIVSYSTQSFSGVPRNISFAPFEKDILQYKDKIILVNVPPGFCDSINYPNLPRPWCVEKSQRSYSLIILKKNFNMTSNDILLISDVDEIFTREAIFYISNHPPDDAYSVCGTLYFPYYFHNIGRWCFAAALRYSDNMDSLQNYREKSYKGKLPKIISQNRTFVTHCSYCFATLEEYRNKLKSFAHQEYNKEQYTNNNTLFKSHYCRQHLNNEISRRPSFDEKETDWSQLIPNDSRLSFLYDPSFQYPIMFTNYSENDLKTLCGEKKFKRTPFHN